MVGVKFRYSRWDGTQRLDDLDAGEVLDALSDDLMNYGDLNAALQRLLRWGAPNMPGLEQLLKQLREARERELGRYNLDSTVEQLRQEVQDVIDTERGGIDRRLDEAALLRHASCWKGSPGSVASSSTGYPTTWAGGSSRCATTNSSTTPRARSSRS